MSVFDVAVWRKDRVVMLDQRLLPSREVYLEYHSAAEVAEGIRTMVVRGAPAIGCAAAFGVAVEAHRLAPQPDAEAWKNAMAPGLATLLASRPTAVNLSWAVERLRPLLESTPADQVPARLLREAETIRLEDIASCRAMGQLGANLLIEVKPGKPLHIMTHCNAGALATAGYGTALGVIRAVREQNRPVLVYATETRPYLQGARLTAWELLKDRIPVTLITDSMSGYLMSKGDIDAVVVGADRIAANGDVANKIGTYTHAVLAKRHNIPFFVAAPLSTIDFACPDGSAIPIEERAPDEVTHCLGQRIAALGVSVRNPAFDCTPAELITAIITERGVVQNPSLATMEALRLA
ncbi:MAG: S-methyl-5-thioribose-1-phosphate isomerase [Magnetococcales bacterium]|nr:S-methyl-5-thioribose-1-phosphate isomerase [Magnetococcales bacterium]